MTLKLYVQRLFQIWRMKPEAFKDALRFLIQFTVFRHNLKQSELPEWVSSPGKACTFLFKVIRFIIIQGFTVPPGIPKAES